jgi:hypothetical protein
LKWPDEAKALLKSCWHPQPGQRPEFSAVAAQFRAWRKSPDFARGLANGTSRGLLEILGISSAV